MHRARSAAHRTRLARRALAALLAAGALTSCSDGAGPGAPDPFPPLAPIVFVSTDDAGHTQLYSLDAEAGTVAPLTATTSNESDPHSAAGLLVFTSDRDGNREIYLAGNDGSGPTRLTTNAAADFDPVLSPAGDQVAFTSDRLGQTRIFLMDATGANVGALATGSSTAVPEQSAAWSPDGTQIAFTSVRTGTSQVFVMPAAGGAAVQVTHETNGAFEPVWSADGASIVYVPAAGSVLRTVTIATGEVTPFPAEPDGVGEPACNATYCVAALAPLGGSATLVAYTVADHRRRPLSARAADDRLPAFLLP
jgi:Tol biopolymer transport system component